ncbi:MAG TPA: sulfotransferase, partial [Candidatus Obscuribacterales bacterium]
MGELLAAHPDVRYVFEAHSVWECAGPGINQSSRLTAQDAKPGVISQIREFFSSEGASSKLVVEKNPRNALRVPYIRAVFPEAKIIHIVRDGRDVACSMRPGCGGEEWRHLKPPDWQELFSRYSGALRCALAWRSVLEIALADLRDVPHIQVRYEDLVADPVSVSRLLLEYVGLPIVPEVADFCKHIQDSTADSYHAANQSRWYRADHARRIGRWQENL